MIGKIVSHYRILEKLGEGGMGVVYKAQDTKLDRFVALKFLPLHLGQAEEEKKRFIHEAKAASALDHTNICTIHEIDETEDRQTFIVMACYEGKILKDKTQRGPLKFEEAIDIAVQIAQGLEKAHQKEIIHRDIKPANILITTDVIVKILDFGLAKLAGRTMLTKEGTTLGTVAYMSPEQAQGAKVDHRTDIWSFGVMLYEMITGQLPFKGDYEQAVIYSIMNEEPEPVTGLRSGIPMELERIVSKALAKNPGERYQNVGDLLVDLRTIKKDLESLKTTARLTRTALPGRNRTYLYIGVVILLMLFMVVGRFLFTERSEAIDSIAVLPLDNLSGDSEQEYFSDGMTEALITELSKIRSLRIISRTSVMRYKKTDKLLPQIARELNVDAVVEGSVLRAGERVRITAQLIGAMPEHHLWAESYDRDLGDILILLSDVAQTIAREIQLTLTPQEQARLTSVHPVNPEAHELYLRGRHHFDKWTKEGFEKAIEYFQQAIEIDPNYAPVYAWLSDSYGWLWLMGVLPPEEFFSKSTALINKALEIEDALPEAHLALACRKLYYEWDWIGAETEFKRAIELNPNFARAHQDYAWHLMAMGRFAEAIAEAKRGQQLDPLSYPANRTLGEVYYYARQYDQAIAQYRQMSELQPSDSRVYSGLARIYEQMGRYEDAVKARQKAMTLSGARPEEIAALSRAYSESGPEGYWMWRLERLKGRYARNPFFTAEIYAQLGDKDQAFAWLEKGYKMHDGQMYRLKVHLSLDPLRDDPRFEDLLRRMNFPE